jgi:hypothetical protein
MICEHGLDRRMGGLASSAAASMEVLLMKQAASKSCRTTSSDGYWPLDFSWPGVAACSFIDQAYQRDCDLGKSEAQQKTHGVLC